jgi:hypothetical protein
MLRCQVTLGLREVAPVSGYPPMHEYDGTARVTLDGDAEEVRALALELVRAGRVVAMPVTGGYFDAGSRSL